MVKNKEEAKYFMLMELILKDNSKMTNFEAKVKLYINMNRINAHIKVNLKMESKVEKVWWFHLKDNIMGNGTMMIKMGMA